MHTGKKIPDWFTDARFGMFIHFGVYSTAARHEWVKNYENLTDEEYARYVEHFDPEAVAIVIDMVWDHLKEQYAALENAVQGK